MVRVLFNKTFVSVLYMCMNVLSHDTSVGFLNCKSMSKMLMSHCTR